MRNNSGSLEKRLAAYGSMSLALAAVSMPVAAQAGSTWYGDITTGIGQNSVYFDPATGYVGLSAQASAFELQTVPGSSSGVGFKARLLIAPFSSFINNGNQFAASASVLSGGSASSVAKLAPGAAVGSALKFSSINGTLASGASSAFGHWNSLPADGDVGLLQACGAGVCYGWANITVNPNYTITLHSFGYDGSGASVTADEAPAAPEPASIVLLALGAAGIAAWRRKKAAAQGR